MVVISSLIHFITNGICSYSMSAKYGSEGTFSYIVCSICAYALPLLIGIVCDVVAGRLKNNSALIRRRFYLGITILGLFFSLVGMYAGPYALGVGNAMATLGCGMGCIQEDSGKRANKMAFAVFMAAGIPGYWIGNVLAEFTSARMYIQNFWITLSVIMVTVDFLYIVYRERSFQFVAVEADKVYEKPLVELSENSEKNVKLSAWYIAWAIAWIAMAIGCALVRCIYNFDWYDRLAVSLGQCVAMVLGRLAGGIIAARVGEKKKLFISINCGLSILATLLIIIFDSDVAGGIAGAFIANAVMSAIGCEIIDRYKKVNGLSIGIGFLGVFISIVLYYYGLA